MDKNRVGVPLNIQPSIGLLVDVSAVDVTFGVPTQLYVLTDGNIKIDLWGTDNTDGGDTLTLPVLATQTIPLAVGKIYTSGTTATVSAIQ